jgi:hypothetical protein
VILTAKTKIPGKKIPGKYSKKQKNIVSLVIREHQPKHHLGILLCKCLAEHEINYADSRKQQEIT